MRVDKMVTKGGNALTLYQILPANSLRECMEICMWIFKGMYGDLYVDIARRLEENK